MLAIIEGVRFWARDDALNEEQNQLDPAVSRYSFIAEPMLNQWKVLRPMSRLGGITYGRVVEGVEIPRPEWDEMKQEAEPAGLAKPKADGQ